MRNALLALAAAAPFALTVALTQATAETPRDPGRPIIVELFTSEGCSSCPPADRLLTELATRKDVLALAFHVTYWNNLGWPDPFSLQAATDRQTNYARISQTGGSYTPQAVIDGRIDVVGSERGQLTRAIAAAARAATPPIALQATNSSAGLHITVAAGSGSAKLLLIGYDPEHVTKVTRGENAGETLRESNIVRSIETIADYSGAALDLTRKLPAGQRHALILQAADGHIIGAARIETPGA